MSSRIAATSAVARGRSATSARPRRSPRRSSHATSGSNVPTSTSATDHDDQHGPQLEREPDARDRSATIISRISVRGAISIRSVVRTASAGLGVATYVEVFDASPVGSSLRRTKDRHGAGPAAGSTARRPARSGRRASPGTRRRPIARGDLRRVGRARDQDDRRRIGQRLDRARELDDADPRVVRVDDDDVDAAFADQPEGIAAPDRDQHLVARTRSALPPTDRAVSGSDSTRRILPTIERTWITAGQRFRPHRDPPSR